MYQKISPDKIPKDALLIDVKNSDEYIHSHLNNSINIPINRIIDIINIEPNRNRNIVIYCSNGKRSYIACISLINLGYKHVYDLDIKK
jgi:rhodanese-related sulfurtransferase